MNAGMEKKEGWEGENSTNLYHPHLFFLFGNHPPSPAFFLLQMHHHLSCYERCPALALRLAMEQLPHEGGAAGEKGGPVEMQLVTGWRPGREGGMEASRFEAGVCVGGGRSKRTDCFGV